MADVQLTTNYSYVRHDRKNLVVSRTSADIFYFFYIDRTDFDTKYKKSTDGGASWGSPVVVHSGANTVTVSVWADWHTPGDSGTKIHVLTLDDGSDDVFYRSLDTNGDSLGTEATVFNGTALVNNAASITKTRGGNLIAAWGASGTDRGAAKSTDGGANWSAIASPMEADGNDQILLWPGNEADNQDVWATYFDNSAKEYTLKTYDNSADSWSESSAIASGITYDFFFLSEAGTIRHGDGHLLFAVVSPVPDQVGTDLLVYDINGAGSITQKTNPITDKDDWGAPGIFINQSTGDIYVTHVGKSDGTETWNSSVKVYSQKSSDGGSSWGSDVVHMDGAATGMGFFFTPIMGYRLILAWMHDDFFFTYSVYVNKTQSLDLTPTGLGNFFEMM